MPAMSRTKQIALAVGGTVVVAAGVVAVILVLGVKRVPSFPSLADDPDPTLHGTVAYVSARDQNQTWCVEVVAASGGASHEVMCSSDYASPTLAWGEDGRLIMTETYPPPARATAVDVVSGATEVVPAAPTDPLASPYGRLDMLPTGERAYISSEGGRSKLTVSGSDGRPGAAVGGRSRLLRPVAAAGLVTGRVLGAGAGLRGTAAPRHHHRSAAHVGARHRCRLPLRELDGWLVPRDHLLGRVGRISAWAVMTGCPIRGGARCGQGQLAPEQAASRFRRLSRSTNVAAFWVSPFGCDSRLSSWYGSAFRS